MAKLKFLKRLKSGISPGIKTGVIIGSTVSGSVIGYDAAQYGYKDKGAKDGAISGLVTGLSLAALPFTGRLLRKGARVMTKEKVRAVKNTGKVIFRRIRGRIIPVKVK